MLLSGYFVLYLRLVGRDHAGTQTRTGR